VAQERFPSNEATFELMADQNVRQLELFPDETAQALVLAHAGNPDDGLCAVYIAAAILRAVGIPDWAFVVRIDHLDSGREGSLPAPVDIDSPELTVLPDEGEEESTSSTDA
jgi:hypothetical protein